MWLDGLRREPALRYYSRPEDVAQWSEPWRTWWGSGRLRWEAIVIHFTAGSYPGDLRTLRGETNRRVSAHFYLFPDGEPVQLVSLAHFSWAHGVRPGASNQAEHWLSVGRNPNSRAISIELSNDGKSVFPHAQITALVNLLMRLCREFDIPADRQHLVGHSELDLWKLDPGPLFPWDDVVARVNEAVTQQEAEEALVAQVAQLQEQLAPKEWLKQQWEGMAVVLVQALNRAPDNLLTVELRGLREHNNQHIADLQQRWAALYTRERAA